ncbi:MAG: methyltransferase domain-containing protein [Desulfobacterales bacterium]|nr:methyltransferase domain-containing protein [Desulfobacterales bacterium]
MFELFSNVYESPDLHTVTGNTIRPGGLTLTKRALDICHLKSGSHILDVGCGLGATIDYLKHSHGLNPVGMDPSLKLLNNGARAFKNLSRVSGIAQMLPFSKHSMAGIFCECVLSLLANPELFLNECKRTLRPSGHLILCDIYSKTPENGSLSDLPVNCCIKGARTKTKIEEMLLTAGFRIICWEDHTALLKELAAKLVFAFGSIHQFWENTCPGEKSETIHNVVNSASPGYYLLIATTGKKDAG